MISPCSLPPRQKLNGRKTAMVIIGLQFGGGKGGQLFMMGGDPKIQCCAYLFSVPRFVVHGLVLSIVTT